MEGFGISGTSVRSIGSSNVSMGRFRPSSDSRGRRPSRSQRQRSSGAQRQRATFRSSASNILASAARHGGGMGANRHKSKNQNTSLPADSLPMAAANNIAPRTEVSTSEKLPTNASKSKLSKGKKPRKPKGMKRATVWSLEVENCYRLQQSGWSTLDEYEIAHGPPTMWFVISSGNRNYRR